MKRTVALLSVMAILLGYMAYAAYSRRIVVGGAVYLQIPSPTPAPTATLAPTPSPTATPAPTPSPTATPSPTPVPTPTPGNGSGDWIWIARDALRRTREDDAYLDALTALAKEAYSGPNGTNAAFGGISDLWGMATNDEQRAWVHETNNRINELHSAAVADHSFISQAAGAMYEWQTDKYVNGSHTAEYEYSMCLKTGDAPGHLNKLKNFALSAKAQADTHDQIVAQAEQHLANAQKAAQDAWAAAAALRQRLIEANQK